ncbi:glucan endo-1,3-beta-glucosidase 7-like [Carex rostrata]
MRKQHVLVILELLQAFSFLFPFSKSQSFIGVNYGEVADNLPPPSSTAILLTSTSISKVRLYGTDAAVISAFAGTNISLLVGVSNGDIPSLAASSSAAAAWVSANIVPYMPATTIASISVGNEVLNSGDDSLPSQLLLAMQNLFSALSANYPSIKISTVHSMAVLSQSDPPSAGAFHPDLAPNLDPVLAFLQQSGSPFMINPYPWFAYNSDPRPETLAFCLFQSNPGRVDSGSGLTYMNMFDAQVDAIRAALDAKGFNDVEIVIAETGWPYKGDSNEVGATVENAQAYNGNLVTHLKSLAGTPRVPGKSVDTYLFALYDEDLKPGPTSERSFGLYKTDLTENYDIGLSKAATNPPSLIPAPDQTQGSTSSSQPNKGETPTGWCLTAASSPGNGYVQPTSTCYTPNAVPSRKSGAHSSVTYFVCMIFHVALLSFGRKVRAEDEG